MSSARPEDMQEFLPSSYVEEVLMGDDQKEGKSSKPQASINVTTNGISLKGEWKDFVRAGDTIKTSCWQNHASLKCPLSWNYSYVFPFIMDIRLPFFLQATPLTFFDNRPCNLAAKYQNDVSRSKQTTREHSWIAELDLIDTPWRVKFEQTLRANTIDAFASKQFLETEALPSIKHSASLEYIHIDDGLNSKFSAELAVPLLGYERSPSFFKLYGEYDKRFEIVRNKINLVGSLKMGKVLPLSTDKSRPSSFANDRLYLHQTSGYI